MMLWIEREAIRELEVSLFRYGLNLNHHIMKFGMFIFIYTLHKIILDFIEKKLFDN